MRRGTDARRALEFAALMDQVSRNKAGLIARIQRHTKTEGQCVVWTGTKGSNGYGRLNVRFNGTHLSIRVHSLALMCMLGRPILKGHEAGHTCANRACIRHVEEQRWQDNLAQRDEEQRARSKLSNRRS